MRWAKVDDDKFDPDVPNLRDTGLVVVPALHEHGPLWRTGLDGFPLLRKNDTIDYPWHGESPTFSLSGLWAYDGLLAWLAGDKSPDGKQSYDVWVAFEFPSFDTFDGSLTPAPVGNIIIKSDHRGFIGLKSESAIDGAPVLVDHTPQEVIHLK